MLVFGEPWCEVKKGGGEVRLLGDTGGFSRHLTTANSERIEIEEGGEGGLAT